jgi:hypothetical protein
MVAWGINCIMYGYTVHNEQAEMPMKNPPHPGELIRTESHRSPRPHGIKGGGDFEGTPRHAL